MTSRGRNDHPPVIPAQAGTQCARTLDCGLRRNDEYALE